uniref:NADH-ubiquinone oxidoreductase chain 4 n=1 Tax=Dinoderus minutus TaxID=1587246 RepID=A0A343C1C0_9COLE|nr:NADH dehydrogenase subunit 4 [Dinoderus minutus]
MMKFIYLLIFMIPLSLNWWFSMFMYLFMFSLFLLKFTGLIYYSFLGFLFGLDLLSYGMVLLSIWICLLMVLASFKVYYYNNYSSLFSFTILVLLFSLVCAFSSLNFFVFYLFFEISLVPTLFLILGWGYQPERIQAGVYLLFYTMLASLPMMVSLFYLYVNLYTLSFSLFMFDFSSVIIMFLMMSVFLVKIPMFLVHLWLPKAHVEAPVAGSMILAGVMLKLGGYGILRLIYVFKSILYSYGYLFIVLSLLGGVLVSLVCLRQSDMKSLIAYSSVAHMGLVLGGSFTLSYYGLVGSFIMMISHGLCSSGLFCLANISYERCFSRSLYVNKGLMSVIPSLSLWWFLFCSSNMAAPPSLNLVSEIVLLSSIISWSSFSMLFLMFMSFFSASYSLFLYSYTQHGKMNSGLFPFSCPSLREFILLFLHWFPLNFMFVCIDLFFV